MRIATTALLMLLSLGADKMKLIPDDARLEKLAGGMQFTEGPIWTDADGGYLVFSDIPTNELKKWDGKTLTTFDEWSQSANGNTRDMEDRLITCAQSARSIMRRESGGAGVTLVHQFEGKAFNSPNDVVVKSDGSIWFTDPTYGLPKGEKKELDGNYVFRFDPHGNTLNKVADGFDMPNGLCFSPDEKFLYIADSGKAHHIRIFRVDDDKLSGGDVFCVIDKGVPDGIRCDEHGNVWSSAGDGVHVFAPNGKLSLKIPVPETPANLCFGGAGGKTLFITARTSLYSIPTNVKGAVRPSKEKP
jgi:gluconolactonase